MINCDKKNCLTTFKPQKPLSNPNPKREQLLSNNFILFYYDFIIIS